MSHGGCGVINPLSSGVRCRADQNGFDQFGTRCGFDPAASYLSYQRSAEIVWSSLRPSNSWFRISLLMVELIDCRFPMSHCIGVPLVSSLLLLRCTLLELLPGSSTSKTGGSLLTPLCNWACPGGSIGYSLRTSCFV